MHNKRIFRFLTITAVAITAVLATPTIDGGSSVAAGTFTVAPLTLVSGPSPFADCTIGAPGTNFVNAEVEPRVDVNPTNANNIVGVWQQDRWSDGGAHGLMTGISHDGGMTWTGNFAHFSLCAGGNAANGGDFDRASDPWVSFAPNGDVYQISLVFDVLSADNGVLVSKSTDGGDTWSEPATVIRNADFLFHDKESITADPTDFHNVYAVWDAAQYPPGIFVRRENVFNFFAGSKQFTMFARTTNAGQSWEAARIIYNPGANNGTIGNQIVVRPDGTLVNLFTEFLSHRNDDGGSHFDLNLSLIRSTDRGATWTHGPAIRAAKLFPFGVVDPDTGASVRTGAGLVDVAVDRANGSLHAVWEDARFSGVEEIAFSTSTDGGLSWSTPIKINKTPRNSTNPFNQQAFVPSVRVAADGTIAVSYYDFRNNDANPGALTDYWLIHCHSSTVTSCADPANWQDEARLTATSFDIEQAPVAGGFFVGDYEGLTSAGDSFVPFFALVNNGNPANRTDIFVTTVSP